MPCFLWDPASIFEGLMIVVGGICICVASFLVGRWTRGWDIFKLAQEENE